MNFDLTATLRRLKPDKRVAQLTRRPDHELHFANNAPLAGPGLLLDTTVYIDALQSRLPMEVEQLIAARQINHSSVALAELTHLFGRLDPAHPETKTTLAAIKKVITAIPDHRLAAPSVQAMAEAGILTGIIARLRGISKTDRQPLLNDVMLFLQASENGHWLLSRNIADMDIVEQFASTGHVIFYRQAA